MAAQYEIINERRWMGRNAQVGEAITGNEAAPVLFQVQFRANPMTRRDLADLAEMLGVILGQVPEAHIITR